MTFTAAMSGRSRRRNGTSMRLDVPMSGRTLLPRPDQEAFARIAEIIARFIGTARFLVIQTVVVVIWISLNVAIPFLNWDPYPFILLNLAFSTQAAYAAPLILLAQNRQDDRDRASLTEDRAAALRMREDTEFLAREVAALRLGVAEVATRQYVRGELAHQFESLRDDLELVVHAAVQTAGSARRSGGRGDARLVSGVGPNGTGKSNGTGRRTGVGRSSGTGRPSGTAAADGTPASQPGNGTGRSRGASTSNGTVADQLSRRQHRGPTNG